MDESSPFAMAVPAWKSRLAGLRNLVRQKLVVRQLIEQLTPLGDPAAIRVLDAGCGQGTVALELARAGFDVTGIDLSRELLDTANSNLAEEPEDVRRHCRFHRGDVTNLGFDAPGPWDLVCCHGVLMYLPSLEEGIAHLLGAVNAGGLLSVLTRNRAGIAMRAGMQADWSAALAGFDARTYDNRVGVEGARADEPAEVAAAIGRAGGTRLAWYGVRLFTDHWGDQSPSEDFESLLAAEEEAGRRDPYRQLAALTHTIAIKSASGVTSGP